MATVTRTRPRTRPIKAADGETRDPGILGLNPARSGDPAEEPVPVAGAVGQFAMLSVAELLAHPDNLREEVKPNPGLVANLKTDGVAGLLQPIIVIGHPDGAGHLILDGHERVASFQEALRVRPDLTHIPAMIRPDLADRAAQIVTMLRTLHRRGLSSVEEARGVRQLALAGLSVAQIAKRTGCQRGQVDDALVVAGMAPDTAGQVAARGLDLHQAAIVADFAADAQAVDRRIGHRLRRRSPHDSACQGAAHSTNHPNATRESKESPRGPCSRNRARHPCSSTTPPSTSWSAA